MIWVNKRLRIQKSIITRVVRKLQSTGTLTVQVGLEVSPETILGRSSVSAGFRSMNLSKELSVSPSEAKKYLQRAVGQNIYKGELLAYKPGFLFLSKKLITAPTDGVLESYNPATGDLLIKFIPHQVSLTASVFGVVEAVDNTKGEVTIKTQASEIYGVLGTGRTREGILKVIGGQGDLVDKGKIKPDLGGKIIVGGGLVYGGALEQAVSSGVKGIISGGINAADYKGMSGGRLLPVSKVGTDIGIGVLISEGFGSIPIGDDIFDVLKKFDGQFVILDGNRGVLTLPSCESDCMVKIKSTALPQDSLLKSNREVSGVTLSLHDRVRVVGLSFMGEQGEVIAIDSAVTLLPSGISTYLLTIQTKSRKFKVPYNNIEVLD